LKVLVMICGISFNRNSDTSIIWTWSSFVGTGMLTVLCDFWLSIFSFNSWSTLSLFDWSTLHPFWRTSSSLSSFCPFEIPSGVLTMSSWFWLSNRLWLLCNSWFWLSKRLWLHCNSRSPSSSTVVMQSLSEKN